uniref:Exoribonuclease phosphorolytic domain-containing protein n=1 Tax=Meloidogyne javanica TaxID=6303 RepID=A0A915MWX9_MELJA
MTTSKTFSTEQCFLTDIFTLAAAENCQRNLESGKLIENANLTIKLKPLKGCVGSANVKMGNTIVSCAVTGPKEQQSGETALEGLLNISLHGIDPALRYSIEHALQAVVCLKKLARTEIDVELNILSDDGGVLAAFAFFIRFDILLPCNILIPTQPPSPPGFPPAFILDPDSATIAKYSSRAALLTLAIIPSIGQIVLTEFSGCPLPLSICQQIIPVAFDCCMQLYLNVRQTLVDSLEELDDNLIVEN